ncbi:MAG: hypothetical protein AAFV53_26480 [Myxococcota bacterium]
MSCACGAPTTFEDATCAQCGRHNFTCPSCGGGISSAPEAVVLACPYCDAPLQSEDDDGQPSYFPVNFSAGETEARLLRFLLNRFGIPGDFQKKWSLESCALVYLPVHLFHVTARFNASIIETDTHAVIRAPGLWYHKALQRYPFAMRVKQRVDPTQIKAQVYPLKLTDQQATAQAQAFGRALLSRDKKRFSGMKATDQGIVAEDAGQVFYPLYEVKYRYSGRTYKCVVDAANGVVCHADHPMSFQRRAQVLAAGGIFFGVTAFGALLLMVVPLFMGDNGFIVVGAVLGGAAMLLTSLLSSARILWSAFQRHRSQEEVDADKRELELPDLTRKMDVPQRKRLAGG